jgi:hypothetical protein
MFHRVGVICNRSVVVATSAVRRRVIIIQVLKFKAAFYYTFVKPTIFAEESTADLNISLQWLSRANDVCVTLTCNSYIWLISRRRFLHGLESLRLQGFPIQLVDSARFTQRQLVDLAGNC